MKDPSCLPNWTKAASYPDINNTTSYQWMWEFLRRNPKYQELCDKFWEPNICPPEEVINLFGLVVASSYPHYSAKTATVKFINIDNAEEVYSLKFDTYEPFVLEPMINEKTGLYEVDGFTTSNPNIVFPKIDLSFSIDSQFRDLKNVLKLHRRKRKLVDKRNHLGKFPLYLRIIDALSLGVGENEIANNLFLDIPNEYPEYLRNERFRDTMISAIRYRDTDYRFIVKESFPDLTREHKKSRKL